MISTLSTAISLDNSVLDWLRQSSQKQVAAVNIDVKRFYVFGVFLFSLKFIIDIVLDGDPDPPKSNTTPPQFSAHVYCEQTVAHLSYC